MRRLPRHAALLLVFLCGPGYCPAQSGGAPPQAVELAEGAWQEFSSAEGGFTVSLPGTPVFVNRMAESPAGRIPHPRYVLETAAAVYAASYVDLPAGPRDTAEGLRLLEAGRDNLLASGADSKLLAEKEVVLDGHAGREWLYQSNGYVFRARAYLIAGRIYQTMVLARPEVAFKSGRPSADPRDRTEFYEMLSSRFLDSYRLTAARGVRGEVDRYMAREKVYDKAGRDSAGGASDAGVLGGKALSLPRVPYPRAAIPERAAGRVTVKVVVDEAGKVVAAQAVSGHPLLQPAAVKAAREARFAPALLGGKPVKVVGTISFDFVVK